ncbi:hypothetical protein OG21DRAFT_446356 [Imleria badia]|nr:hypothetical protein OG21DRAFT_446356 [Imleria badia]
MITSQESNVATRLARHPIPSPHILHMTSSKHFNFAYNPTILCGDSSYLMLSIGVRSHSGRRHVFKITTVTQSSTQSSELDAKNASAINDLCSGLFAPRAARSLFISLYPPPMAASDNFLVRLLRICGIDLLDPAKYENICFRYFAFLSLACFGRQRDSEYTFAMKIGYLCRDVGIKQT